MEGKLITTKGLEAYTQQFKTFIGDTYQTKADMALYKKTNELFNYLDTRYIAKDSSLYCNPIYKHTITVVHSQYFGISLTIFTTRAEKYNTAEEFRKDWAENRKIISVLADASSPGNVFEGTVGGVIDVSSSTGVPGSIAVRISGIQAGSTTSNWDEIYTLSEWNYWNEPGNQQPNPCRI